MEGEEHEEAERTTSLTRSGVAAISTSVWIIVGYESHFRVVRGALLDQWKSKLGVKAGHKDVLLNQYAGEMFKDYLQILTTGVA